MERLLRIPLVIILALGFATANAGANSPEPKVADFQVDGLTLFMPIDDFRQLYPAAEVTEKTAARYCFGDAVRIEPLTRLASVVRRGATTVHVTFDQKYFGQRISTIKRDQVIEFSPTKLTSLSDELVRLYGPYTRMKYPDKMEPAGLIVGFEWQQKGVASLSVTLHRDHAKASGPLRQTTFLTRSLPGMEGHRMAAAYYRGAVRDFRGKCARR